MVSKLGTSHLAGICPLNSVYRYAEDFSDPHRYSHAWHDKTALNPRDRTVVDTNRCRKSGAGKAAVLAQGSKIVFHVCNLICKCIHPRMHAKKFHIKDHECCIMLA